MSSGVSGMKCSRSCFWISVFLVIVLMGVAPVGAAVSADDDAWLLVAGQRAGLFRLGQAVPEDARQRWGKPDAETAVDGPDSGNLTWNELANVKIGDEAGRPNIYQVFVISPRFHTAEGIAIGSTEAELKRAYPSGRTVEAMEADFSWCLPGISFDVCEGRVCGIGIHPLRPEPAGDEMDSEPAD